jgi:hypothetical protein
MEEWRTFQVPEAIEPEVNILVEQLKLAAGQDGPFEAVDVALTKSQVKEFDGGPLVETALFVASTPVVTWITKAWLEKYVLPVILERVRKPSEQFQEWLKRVLGGPDSKEDDG